MARIQWRSSGRGLGNIFRGRSSGFRHTPRSVININAGYPRRSSFFYWWRPSYGFPIRTRIFGAFFSIIFIFIVILIIWAVVAANSATIEFPLALALPSSVSIFNTTVDTGVLMTIIIVLLLGYVLTAVTISTQRIKQRKVVCDQIKASKAPLEGDTKVWFDNYCQWE